MEKLQFLIFVFCLASFFQSNAQNGWTRDAKGLYAQASVSAFSSKNYYNTSGTLFNGGSTFQSQMLSLYGEYGVTNRLTVIGDLPVLMVNSFNTTEPVLGIGSAIVGLKYGLSKKFPLSIQADFDIPTDDGINFSNSREPNAIGIIERINLPTSDGEFNIRTILAASKSFNKGKSFASIFGGVNFRTESFSDQLQAGIELGHLFFDKIYLIGKLRIQDKLESNSPSTGSFLYGEGTTFTNYNFTAIYKLNSKWRLIAGYSDFEDFIVKKRNIYDGAMYSLGAAYEFSPE